MIQPEKPNIDIYYSENALQPFNYKNIVKNKFESETIGNVNFFASP
jgi:hypothetical protein